MGPYDCVTAAQLVRPISKALTKFFLPSERNDPSQTDLSHDSYACKLETSDAKVSGFNSTEQLMAHVFKKYYNFLIVSNCSSVAICCTMTPTTEIPSIDQSVTLWFDFRSRRTCMAKVSNHACKKEKDSMWCLRVLTFPDTAVKHLALCWLVCWPVHSHGPRK